MTDTETPAAPSDLGERGAAFWQSAVTAFELSDTELELLVECCRLLDEVESLRDALTRDGVTVLGSTKQPRVHPALAQRSSRIAWRSASCCPSSLCPA